MLLFYSYEYFYVEYKIGNTIEKNLLLSCLLSSREHVGELFTSVEKRMITIYYCPHAILTSRKILKIVIDNFFF